MLFCFLVVLRHDLTAQSTDYDEAIGETAAQIYIATYGIYHDPELKDFVDQVGNSLVGALTEDVFAFRFYIIDEHTPNAFALPGGYIFVSRGLLALINSPDELAGVLAHEIVHVQKRHGVHQKKQNILPSLIEAPFKIAGNLIGGKLGKIVETPSLLGTAMKSSYSKKQESEADQLGIVLAARAGYDPMALASILKSIAEWEATLSEQEEVRSFFSDHPYTPDRIATIQNNGPQLTWNPNTIRDVPLENILSDLLVWVNPSKGVFIDNVFLHPELDISVNFPKNAVYTNQVLSVKSVDKENGSFVSATAFSTSKSPKTLAKEYIKEVKELLCPVVQHQDISVGFPVSLPEYLAHRFVSVRNIR